MSFSNEVLINIFAFARSGPVLEGMVACTELKEILCVRGTIARKERDDVMKWWRRSGEDTYWLHPERADTLHMKDGPVRNWWVNHNKKILSRVRDDMRNLAMDLLWIAPKQRRGIVGGHHFLPAPVPR